MVTTHYGIRMMRELSHVQFCMMQARPESVTDARALRGGHKTLIALERRYWVSLEWGGLRWHPDVRGVVWCEQCKRARWLLCHVCNQIELPFEVRP